MVLSVPDNGIGIAPEMLPRIFDCSRRIGRRSIARRAVSGSASPSCAVWSAPRRLGHCAERRPRAGRLVQSGCRSNRARANRPRGAPAGPRRATAAPRRVLVVDDNVDAAVMLATGLSAAGHATEPRTTARRARARRLIPTGCGLLDIGLPVMDGFELARRRSDRELRRTRLIAITGYGQEHDRRRARLRASMLTS